ncbi:MAG TPA: TonB-dependent receptor [Cellvibrio sp.]|nr:TonB-dependent receptor [Cellvibrio sp.]
MKNQSQKNFVSIPTMAKSSLAVGIAATMLMPLGAFAEEAKAANKDEPKKVLETVKVEATALEANPNAQAGVPYKAQFSGDDRHTRPIAETPQNITVLTKAQIEESGYTDLGAILDAQPGITLGTGENGNAFGDRYIIRGQEVRSDIFVDGLRDPGMTTRESFVVEQIEITKGPNSSFAGRGSSGGAVNAITKQATTDYDFTSLTAGLGTDNHHRLTLDSNQALTEELAVRVNLLTAKEDIPDRAPTYRERQGAAISGFYNPTEEFEMTLDYYGLDAKDNPDLGTYLEGSVPNRKPAKNVPVYAQDEDFQESDVDTFTARLKYRFNSDLRITNITRKGTSDNGYVVTGANSRTTGAKDPNGVYTTASLSTHQGWQEVDYVANQTNLFINQTIGGMEHEFIVSAEYTDHSVLNGVYASTSSGQNCTTGNGTTLNAWCVFDKTGKEVANINKLMNRKITKGIWDIDWAVKAKSISIMDTVDLNDKWTVFAGVRADKFDFDLGTQSSALVVDRFDYSDTLTNSHVGVVYDINSVGNVYFTWSTAADINGGESDVGTSAGYGGTVVYTDPVTGKRTIATASPESSENLELGTKWNIFDETLLLTGAIFQVTKSDLMEGVGYTPGGTFNTGKLRVRGIEFGASGQITDKLVTQAGITYMEAEVLESAPLAGQTVSLNIGKTISNFANTSLNLQLKYQLTEKFGFGGAWKYESKKYAGQPDTAAAYVTLNTGAYYYSQPIPEYAVLDLFATYDFSKNLDVRLNIGNVTDKDYYLAAYRSGSFVYKGDARTARVTLNYNF